jgi:hypothetical protein
MFLANNLLSPSFGLAAYCSHKTGRLAILLSLCEDYLNTTSSLRFYWTHVHSDTWCRKGEKFCKLQGWEVTSVLLSITSHRYSVPYRTDWDLHSPNICMYVHVCQRRSVSSDCRRCIRGLPQNVYYRQTTSGLS